MKMKFQDSYKEIVVCSTYFDANIDMPLKLINLLKYCAKNQLEIITGCDANAHHTIWGDKTIDRRGEDVLDLKIEYDLQIINRGCTPTFVRQNSGTIIDLTLSSEYIANQMKNWRVSNTESCSDHNT